MLSVFAFAPSVLANDIPLATLSVENIQVRAEWNMVGGSANHFSVEGGTLMLKPGAKAGDIIATVEVRDKFSTLNPNYEDLKVTVMITVVIFDRNEYLNVHAPLISGFYAGKGRTVTVSSAFPSDDGNQVFYVNLSLGNILNELYPPKVIIDDGKAFSISGKYPIGNSYAYFANLTAGSDSVDKQSPHEVIVLNHACPTISEATTKDLLTSSSLLIEPADLSKVKAYVLVDGRPYKVKNTREVRTLGIEIILEDDSIDFTGQFQIKFSDDHFLCEGYQ